MKLSFSRIFSLFVFFPILIFAFTISVAQCPIDEADLANGGTFSGTCNVPVGASIIITGDVIWTSGTLTITDGGTNPGDIIISASGSLTVTGGTVQTGDATDGSLEVNGDLTIASGATVSIHDEIHIENGGTADISGRLERLENSGSGNFNSVFIDGGGVMTINSGGVLSTNNSTIPEGNALWDMVNVQGTLVSAGTIYAMDFLVDGTDGEGIVTIQSGGIINAHDNLQVFNGAVFTINAGATVNVTDDAYNDSNLPGPSGGSPGRFNIYGTLNVGNDLTIIDTSSPDSGLFGSGTIDVSGTYTDNECPLIGDFCSCTGTAVGPCGGTENFYRGPGGVGDTDGTTNLTLWLDASKLAGLSDGNNLTGWSDLSGYGNDALVGTAAPSYSSTGGGNGFPSVSFDDSNSENLYVAGNTEVLPTEVSVFVAGNVDKNTPLYGSLINASDDNAWNDGWGIGIDDYGGVYGLFYYTLWNGSDGVDWCGISPLYTPGVNNIYGLIYNSGIGGGTAFNYESEAACSFNDGNGGLNYDAAGNNDLLIGAGPDNSGPAYYMTGDIEEVILFDVDINTAQRIIIDNYLSAKYDIALVANDVYNEDDNGDYDFDVAGIGQASDGSNHTDSQGTGIVRILNPRGLGNNEFLMWGHDNGEEFATETSDVPGGGDPVEARFDCVWRVSEVNSSGTGVDVGNIDMRWDLTGKGQVTASDLRLLFDTDNDGTFADETPISGATLVSGDIYEFTAVSSIVNNRRFTLATVDASRTPLGLGPGGVFSNLALWLNAGAGTSTTTDGADITQWNDQSSYRNHATQAGSSNYATYETNIHNYNPSVYFTNGDNGYFDVDLDLIKGSDYNLIGVVERDNSVASNYFMGITGGGTNERLHFGYRDNTIATLAHWGNDVNLTVNAFDSPAQSVAVLRGELDQTVGKTVYELRDGISVSNLDTDKSVLTGTGSGRVGHDHTTNRGFEGYLSELVVYNSTLSAVELTKVYSYFALKYALTLDNSGGGTDGDYTASDGTLIWDASDGSAYQNEIIAIGRDDKSALLQKQSRYQDDSLKIFIDNLAADNASNAGTITNDVSFIVIGHNDVRLMAYSPNEVPAGILSRFDREWKITNTNFTDTYSLEFEWEEVGGFDISHIRLLVDDDGDFSDATILGTGDGLTFSVGSIIVGGIGTTHIPAGSTKYITIGSVAAATPLPIELIDFTAKATDDFTVKLDWQTASENNNDFFTIERSKDAEDWKEVLMVNGAGNSSKKITYTATDKNPYSGISYYRLKQTDFDGQFTYSEIRVVNLNNLGGKELKIYPNPGNGIITIEGDLTKLATFKLYTVFGQEVSNMVRISGQNNEGMIIDISNLSDGVYTMKTKNYISKIIKQ